MKTKKKPLNRSAIKVGQRFVLRCDVSFRNENDRNQKVRSEQEMVYEGCLGNDQHVYLNVKTGKRFYTPYPVDRDDVVMA